MMKRIYNWITKANQVLLFFGIIGAAVLVSRAIYEGSRRYEPPHVAVAQTLDEAKNSVVENVRFLGQASGFYIFGIVKHVVSTGDEPWRKRSLLPSSSLGNEEMSSGEMVNVVFSRGEQRVRTLLPNDGLVISENVEQRRSDKTKALLFLCVTEDTDGNHRLDSNDRNDLYVISDGLEKPDLVVKDVSFFRVISPAHLAVKTGERNDSQFWDIDTETQAKREVVWK